ncbi:MAG: hypothetical protein GEU79_04535 [Acidimicrobiia bacterium]|nr:hypothetical protein [Acidimicrobiia bacterium]
METLFENVFPLLILFLVVGWWILRGVFRVVRRSVVGMDEVVEVGHRPEVPAPAEMKPLAPIEQEMRNPDRGVPEPAPEASHINSLPSIEDLARENRRARDRMREDLPAVIGFGDASPIRDAGIDVITYPEGSEAMLADAWAKIYGDESD